MPGKVKMFSEYEEKFMWNQSRKSASYKPSGEQDAPIAGLNSGKLVVNLEPPILRKKRTVGIEPTVAKIFHETEETQSVRDDDYFLLGNQDKFNANIKYNNKVKSEKEQGRRKENAAEISNEENGTKPNRINSKTRVVSRPQYEVGTEQPSIPQVTTEDKESTDRPPTPTAPRDPPRKSVSEPIMRPKKPIMQTYKVSRSHFKKNDSKRQHKSSSNTEMQPVGRMNEFVQTNLDKGIADSGCEAPQNYALQYKAGVAPPRIEPPKYKSEYEREYHWKKGFRGQTPIIAADMMIHKSDPALAPPKIDVVPKVSEYKSNFRQHPLSQSMIVDHKNVKKQKTKDDEPSPKKNKLTKSRTAEKLKEAVLEQPAGKPSELSLLMEKQKKVVQEALNPQKPFFPHGKHRRSKSEYLSNYRSPLDYRYENGAWVGANPPHIRSSREEDTPRGSTGGPSWFHEVVELRRKAEEYRKRAQGTHFSQEHLVQLLAKNAELWDASSASSRTVIALNLDVPAAVKSMKPTKKAPTKPETHEAWSETSTKQHVETGCSSVSSNKSIDQKMNSLDDNEEHDTEQTEGSTVTIDTHRTEVTATDKSSTVIGRMPTPRIVNKEEIHRHHLDLTTPAAGGALLVSPPRIIRDLNLSLSPDSIKADGKRTYVKGPHVSDESSIKEKPRGLRSKYTLNVPRTPKNNYSDVKCSCGVESQLQRVRSASPTYGKPTDDDCPLRDDNVTFDKPAELIYAKSSPPKHTTKRVNNRNLNVPEVIQEGFGQTYNKPTGIEKAESWNINLNKMADDIDDDALSTSIRSIASSCSLASETLERARTRRDEFWGSPRDV